MVCRVTEITSQVKSSQGIFGKVVRCNPRRPEKDAPNRFDQAPRPTAPLHNPFPVAASTAAHMPFRALVAAFASAGVQMDIQGAGASFPNRLYKDAIFAYRFVEPSVSLTYTSTGSGSGKCRIKNWCATGQHTLPRFFWP